MTVPDIKQTLIYQRKLWLVKNFGFDCMKMFFFPLSSDHGISRVKPGGTLMDG